MSLNEILSRLCTGCHKENSNSRDLVVWLSRAWRVALRDQVQKIVFLGHAS